MSNPTTPDGKSSLTTKLILELDERLTKLEERVLKLEQFKEELETEQEDEDNE